MNGKIVTNENGILEESKTKMPRLMSLSSLNLISYSESMKSDYVLNKKINEFEMVRDLLDTQRVQFISGWEGVCTADILQSVKDCKRLVFEIAVLLNTYPEYDQMEPGFIDYVKTCESILSGETI